MSIDPGLDPERSMQEHQEQATAGRPPELARPEMIERTGGFDPAPGTQVLTSDGREAGRVQSVKDGYFALDCGDPEFWLSCAYIASNEGERVHLSIPANELEEHRLRKPGIQTLDRNLAGTGTQDQTELHSLRVRELMEQELVQQRGTMDTGLTNERD
ncbi:MAG: hypothetical protein ACM3S1_14550 [Hyphomicrobiales bacterium]